MILLLLELLRMPAECQVESMNANEPLAIVIGDVVRLKKPHPCGSYEWTVTRRGADIGLRCHGCDRRVMLSRRTLQKRIKTFVSRGPAWELADQLLANESNESTQ